jgi:hypothetical protein
MGLGCVKMGILISTYPFHQKYRSLEGIPFQLSVLPISIPASPLSVSND